MPQIYSENHACDRPKNFGLTNKTGITAVGIRD